MLLAELGLFLERGFLLLQFLIHLSLGPQEVNRVYGVEVDLVRVHT